MAKFKIADVLSPYFSFKGRIARGEFWAYGVALGFFAFVAALLARLLPTPAAELAMLGIWALTMVAYGGLLVKRGHDRGRPALLSLIILVLRGAVSVSAELLGYTPLILTAQVVLILYVFIDYACMPGRPGSNRYGPSPSGLGVTKPLILGEDSAPDGSALPASPPNA